VRIRFLDLGLAIHRVQGLFHHAQGDHSGVLLLSAEGCAKTPAFSNDGTCFPDAAVNLLGALRQNSGVRLSSIRN